jgi:hypothetical protein
MGLKIQEDKPFEQGIKAILVMMKIRLETVQNGGLTISIQRIVCLLNYTLHRTKPKLARYTGLNVLTTYKYTYLTEVS